MAIKKIGLDAGHGIFVAGKQTPDGIKENYLNDIVCDKVMKILSGYDVEIIRTDNNEGNVDESLTSRRTMYVNAKVDAFVSIHHNATSSAWVDNVTGVEVFTDRNQTAQDTLLAKAIYKNLPSYTGLKGRGIKEANFTVINQNKIPAVLVESGFMNSSIDYPVITSDKGQEGYAKAVAEGLIEFLGLTKKTVASTLYRVGTSWSNGKCVGQVGAFSNKDNAIKKAKENKNWKVFDENGSVIYQYEEEKKPTPVVTPTVNTNKIDTVREVQNWANSNYNAGLAVDGSYGSKTKKALIKILQTELNQTYKAGLAVDGSFGSKTKAAISNRNLSKGTKNDVVKVLQAFLVCNKIPGVYVDGSYGNITVKAVKTYQKKKGLKVDGIAGKGTFTKLCA